MPNECQLSSQWDEVGKPEEVREIQGRSYYVNASEMCRLVYWSIESTRISLKKKVSGVPWRILEMHYRGYTRVTHVYNYIYIYIPSWLIKGRRET